MAKRKRQVKQDGDPREVGNLLPGDREGLGAVMFDPGEQHLDLTKSEKLRTTALLMAINYIRETICNDAELYRAMRQDGKNFVAASLPYILTCSVEFEDFLLGRYSNTNVGMVKRGAAIEQKRAAAAAEQSGEGATAEGSAQAPESAQEKPEQSQSA